MLNRVILMGRLTADPELRKTASDLSVTSFTLAVDRNYGKGADRQTDFINCVAWRQTAEFISRYFSKGKLMALEGSIQVRNYVDKNDNKRQAVEVLVDQAFFAEAKELRLLLLLWMISVLPRRLPVLIHQLLRPLLLTHLLRQTLVIPAVPQKTLKRSAMTKRIFRSRKYPPKRSLYLQL